MREDGKKVLYYGVIPEWSMVTGQDPEESEVLTLDLSEEEE